MIQDAGCALVLSKNPFFLVHYLFVFMKLQKNISFVLFWTPSLYCLLFDIPQCFWAPRGAEMWGAPPFCSRRDWTSCGVDTMWYNAMIQIMGKTLFCLKSLRLKSLRDTAAAAARRVCIGRCGQYRGRGQMSDRHHVPVIRLGNMDNITDRPNKWQNQFWISPAVWLRSMVLPRWGTDRNKISTSAGKDLHMNIPLSSATFQTDLSLESVELCIGLSFKRFLWSSGKPVSF